MKKRILYIGNALSTKGATVTSIETLGNFLREEGFEVTAASSHKNKAIRLIDMMLHVLRYAKKADYVLIDTYSTSNYWYAVIVGKLSRLMSLPYIPILRGGNLPYRLESNPKTSHILFEKAYLNIAPSSYLGSFFEKAGFTNLKYIPNTIETKNYPYLKRKFVGPKLLWVRSFALIYNPMMALQVLKELLKEYPEASLTMVGPVKDESYDECDAFAKAQELPVTFTGLLSKDAWIELAGSHDIFINTTNFDNTPVSVIEAMALGLPVVSTDVGGMPFLIENKKDGLLCPANNVEPFVDCLSSLLSTPELVQHIAENARIKAETFDWNTVKKSWEELLS